MEPPAFPSHLRHYLPGRMRLTDLSPSEYWQTDVIDMELGRAVQSAWSEGVDAAKQGHEAEATMRKAIAERYGGQA